MVNLLHGDCIQLMQELEDNSIDMILCDLPYGTSACAWDTIIPFDALWEQYKRLIKQEGAIVLFSQQPFTSALIMSNTDMYKYNWIWVKDNASNFLNKKYQPGKITEDICVFGKGATSYSSGVNMTYNPQLTSGKAYTSTSGKQKNDYGNSTVRTPIQQVETVNEGTRLPNNLLYFNRDKSKVHPTQKPVALLEYLIKTYTNENDIVLDNTMGSGSTGVACVNTKRNFVGIELDNNYFNIAKERIEERQKEIESSLW